MVQKLRERLKEQKGFTLIELLAVIVILGILAAIAVPSIMNIINNSKIDAHISNAQEMANSAKLYINEQKLSISADSANPTKITLYQMMSDGILDNIKDPSAASGASDPNYGSTSSGNTCSYVAVSKDANGKVMYNVTLVSSDGSKVYANGYTQHDSSKALVDAFSLQRADINP